MAKELANQTANALPSFLQNFASAKDTSKMDASDFSIPSISLVQPTSEIAGDDPTKIGKFVNSLTGEAFDSLRVYSLGMRKVFRVVSEDTEDQEYFGFRTTREEAEDLAREHLGSVVQEGHQNYVVRADNNSGLAAAIIHASSKSAVRSSRDWNTSIVMEYGNVPRQALVWKLSPKKIKYSKGSSVGYVIEATVDGHVPDEATMRQLVELSESVLA
jgi:hypothetical protein